MFVALAYRLLVTVLSWLALLARSSGQPPASGPLMGVRPAVVATR